MIPSVNQSDMLVSSLQRVAISSSLQLLPNKISSLCSTFGLGSKMKQLANTVVSQKRAHPLLLTEFLYRVKVYFEHPSWSEHFAWLMKQFESIASSAIDI